MKIDPNAKYMGFLLLLDNLDEQSAKRLTEDAKEHFGDPWGLALKDFFDLYDGNLSYIGIKDRKDQVTASIRQYMWMKCFRGCVDSVIAIINDLVVPQSEDAQKANAMCLKMDSKESILVFVRKYFGLKNFSEAAENITVADFVIAKKDSYNNAMFHHAMNEIQRQKFKKK